eukprot:SAG31_NODE_7375_length_1704_cov_5.230727_2_plen_95_part_00
MIPTVYHVLVAKLVVRIEAAEQDAEYRVQESLRQAEALQRRLDEQTAQIHSDNDATQLANVGRETAVATIMQAHEIRVAELRRQIEVHLHLRTQ